MGSEREDRGRTMEPQPLIAVADVEASSLWYRRLLGCESGHGGRTMSGWRRRAG